MCVLNRLPEIETNIFVLVRSIKQISCMMKSRLVYNTGNDILLCKIMICTYLLILNKNVT